jgi:hypothetical protein
LFISELKDLKHLVHPARLILGDFNLIYQDSDKNNNHLNMHLMSQFRQALNHLEVQEIQLIGWQFTWSSGQRSSVMTRIDHAFCTVSWEELHVDPVMQAISSSASDHCPIHLTSQQRLSVPPIFCFEAHWPYMPGFTDCVHQAWDKPVASHHNAMMGLHIKLSREAKALAIWARGLMPLGKLAAAICREVIFQLEAYQEGRSLSDDGQELLKLLKKRLPHSHRAFSGTSEGKAKLA